MDKGNDGSNKGKDKEVVKMIKGMKKAGVRNLREDKWEIEGDLVLKEEKVYMLKNEKLRIEIIWLHHNVLVVRHKKRWKTVELVTKNYWWLEVTKNIGKYVKECDLCQRMKNRTKTSAEKSMINEILEKA